MNICAALVVVVLLACGGHPDQRAAAPAAPPPTPAEQPPLADKPRTPPASVESKIAATRRKLHNYAYEAFPMWAVSHPDRACPDKLADLTEFLTGDDTKDAKDAWDRPLTMMCGAILPPGARGIAILSNGADGKEGTEDDLRSW